MSDGGLPPPRLDTPSLARRLASFVYEGVLLFGVVMATGLLYGVLVGQRHALTARWGLQLSLFVVLAAYFAWFWTHGGQTLAMKAWKIRLLAADGTTLTLSRALARYLAAWLWFAPALATLWLADAHDAGAMTATLAAGVVGYAALAWLRADRQFWHDAACGTRLVDWHPSPRR